MDASEYIRTRNVCLKKILPEGQAAKACAVLQSIKGVHLASPISKHRLKLTYSLEFLTFELIEGLLQELNFELDLSLPAYLRRYYYQYMEDKVRETLVINEDKHQLTCTIDPKKTDKPDEYWDEYH